MLLTSFGWGRDDLGTGVGKYGPDHAYHPDICLVNLREPLGALSQDGRHGIRTHCWFEVRLYHLDHQTCVSKIQTWSLVLQRSDHSMIMIARLVSWYTFFNSTLCTYSYIVYIFGFVNPFFALRFYSVRLESMILIWMLELISNDKNNRYRFIYNYWLDKLNWTIKFVGYMCTVKYFPKHSWKKKETIAAWAFPATWLIKNPLQLNFQEWWEQEKK